MEFIIVSVLLIATASFVGGWALVSFYKAELHYGTFFHTNTQQQSDIEEIDSQKIFEPKISLLDRQTHQLFLSDNPSDMHTNLF